MNTRTDSRDRTWDVALPASPEDFSEFYARTWKTVFARASSILHDPDAAEEALQLCFSHAWELLLQASEAPHASTGRLLSIRTPSPELTDVLTAEVRLLRIADLHIDRLRKRFQQYQGKHVDLEHALELPHTGLSVADHIARHQASTSLSEYLQQLAPEHRVVISLYYVEEWAQGKIAQVLGIDRSAVSRRIDRAIEELQLLIPYSRKDDLLLPRLD